MNHKLYFEYDIPIKQAKVILKRRVAIARSKE